MNNKLKIRKGDNVKVLSGKDKGKTGKVIAAYPKTATVVVENINLRTRFERAKQAGKPGQKVVFSAPIRISKLQLVDSNSGKPSRVGFSMLDNGSKQRMAKKSKKAI